MPALRHHLDVYAQPGQLGLACVGEKGAPQRRCNFSDRWAAALEAAGLTDVHFHDLRHSGNTWAASSGASLRDLMRRMGHASSDAALRYQHASSDRDRAIADALSQRIHVCYGIVVNSHSMRGKLRGASETAHAVLVVVEYRDLHWLRV